VGGAPHEWFRTQNVSPGRVVWQFLDTLHICHSISLPFPEENCVPVLLILLVASLSVCTILWLFLLSSASLVIESHLETSEGTLSLLTYSY